MVALLTRLRSEIRSTDALRRPPSPHQFHCGCQDGGRRLGEVRPAARNHMPHSSATSEPSTPRFGYHGSPPCGTGPGGPLSSIDVADAGLDERRELTEPGYPARSTIADVVSADRHLRGRPIGQAATPPATSLTPDPRLAGAAPLEAGDAQELGRVSVDLVILREDPIRGVVVIVDAPPR